MPGLRVMLAAVMAGCAGAAAAAANTHADLVAGFETLKREIHLLPQSEAKARLDQLREMHGTLRNGPPPHQVRSCIPPPRCTLPFHPPLSAPICVLRVLCCDVYI